MRHRRGLDRERSRAPALALRPASWEVVRLRAGRLELLGPHDLRLSTWNDRALDRLIETFRGIRGPLLVDAYLR